MIVILEGPDGSGKSSLATAIATVFNFHYQPSEGRPKYRGEFVERVNRYFSMDNTVFDRHPIISQAIYGKLRASSDDAPTNEMIDRLRSLQPLNIYCRATDLQHHVLKDYDTPEHIKQITDNAQQILRLYDEWALSGAQVIYRIGQHIFPVMAIIRSYQVNL